jgi:MPBQ/MSBQ methyltransferase
LFDVAESCCSQQQIAEAPTSIASSSYTPWAIAGGAALALLAIKRVYDTPSRSYNNNVGDEYDAWTDEGILEYYWGEHIHLGYYTEEERAKGWWKADFKAAKLRFTQEMFNFSGSKAPKRILDVGCGFGGSSRWLAATFPDAEVTGEAIVLVSVSARDGVALLTVGGRGGTPHEQQSRVCGDVVAMFEVSRT